MSTSAMKGTLDFKQQRAGRPAAGKKAAAEPATTRQAAAAEAAALPAPALQEEAAEAALRQFDLTSKFGPCVGISRLERWERAAKLGLDPPAE